MLLKLTAPLHVSILKFRKGEKPIVLATRKLEWRYLLFCNSIQTNDEFRPVDLKHQGAIGIL